MTDVRVFQVYYRKQQLAALDPAFEPYDNIGDLDALMEFNVFRKIARKGEVGGCKYWGAVSWKFGQKAGMTGRELLSIVHNNPGFDVYFCNPHTDTEALYNNLWVQGETAHPKFIPLAKEIFAAAGLRPESIDELWPASLFSSTNYFVATAPFWEDYLRFVEDVLHRAASGLSALGSVTLRSSMADAKGLHANATYLPFVVERLFSTFLLERQGRYRAYKYLTHKSLLERNVHLRLLREMKDQAIATRSDWLASCWSNYRRMYLARIHGIPWLKAHAPLMIPKEMRYPAVLPEIVYPAVTPPA